MKNRVIIRRNTILCDHKQVKVTFGPTVSESDNQPEEAKTMEERR